MEYIESLSGESDGCFLCEYRDQADRDRENLVLWRGPQCLAVLNRFPYTGGHAMVAPLEHIADLDGFFAELKRICRPAGSMALSAMHPTMMLTGITARFADPATGRDTRPQSYPNQICDYVMAATRAGLRFDHLSEHAVHDALAATSPRAVKYLGWPLLLLMRLTID